MAGLSDVSAVAQVIQLSVAPIFLLSGIVAMLAAMTSRLSGMIDGARFLDASEPGSDRRGVALGRVCRARDALAAREAPKPRDHALNDNSPLGVHGDRDPVLERVPAVRGRLRLKTKSLVALACLGLAACGPVPGGSLSGQVTPVPSDWSTALPDQRAICEVESRPADPHSIQLECFLYEGALYVQSHRWANASWWPTRSWAAIWAEQPNVRVRLDDALYEVIATQVTDAKLRENVLQFRGYDPAPEGIVLFRFEPRS